MIISITNKADEGFPLSALFVICDYLKQIPFYDLLYLIFRDCFLNRLVFFLKDNIKY